MKKKRSNEMENKCDMDKKAKEAPSIHNDAYPISFTPSSLEAAKSSAANHGEEPRIISEDKVHVLGFPTKEASSSSSIVEASFVDVSKYEESTSVVIVAVVFLHLIVVNWSGDEIAQLEVRPSDLVLTGMRQVEEQLGVPVARQMLVCNEDLLESGRAWSSYSSVRDWSTIQLTTMEQTFDAASDREALMVLFESCGGPGWPDNEGWGSAEPLSSWPGVSLDSEGRVIHLMLYRNRLSGVIPPEIGNLRALTLLNLGFNLLTGSIPPEIGHLTALTHLNLRCNLLTGGIPPELGNLCSLTILELRSNQLTGAIPIQLGRLKDLDCLSLSGNQLTDQMIDCKFDLIATQQFLGSLGSRYPKRRCAIDSSLWGRYS